MTTFTSFPPSVSGKRKFVEVEEDVYEVGEDLDEIDVEITGERRDTAIGLRDVSYKQVALSGEVVRWQVPKYAELFRPSMPCHPFYQHHNQNFDVERLLYPNLPVHVGPYHIKYDKDRAREQIVNVLRCPLKVAGNREIVLPVELEFLREFVNFCCIYECSFNEARFTDLFAHMTVDYKEIQPGDVHRVPGWHVDGFQGCKFPIKHEIEHSYLWADSMGTEFCVQPFFISHIDDSKYLIFDEMNRQAREDNIYSCLPSNLYVFDPYMVHRSPVAGVRDGGEVGDTGATTKRLLVRLTFEYQKLLDPNDTQNLELPFDIPYKYDIRNRLGSYELPADPEAYGYRHVTCDV